MRNKQQDENIKPYIKNRMVKVTGQPWENLYFLRNK